MTRVSASIVLYRTVPPGFTRALAGLAAQSHAVDHLRVHGNALEPGAAETAADLLRLCRVPSSLTTSEDNRGFSGAHNTAVGQLLGAGADAVLLHNPDLVLAPGAVAALAAAAAATPLALLGPVLQLADPLSLEPTGHIDTTGIVWAAGGRHLDRDQGRPWPPALSRISVVAGISGAALLVTRAAHDHLVAVCGELLDEDFIAYREDAELGFRAALLGVPSLVVPAAEGLHARGLRGTQRGTSEHVDRLGVRNRFLLSAKYGTARPGGLAGPLARDAVVLAGVALRERSSWAGVTDAWRLRRIMRAKGRRVLEAAVVKPRRATRP